jgi:hypothetical protein
MELIREDRQHSKEGSQCFEPQGTVPHAQAPKTAETSFATGCCQVPIGAW